MRWTLLLAAVGCLLPTRAHSMIQTLGHASGVPSPTEPLALDTLPNCTTQYDCYTNPAGDECADHTYSPATRTITNLLIRDSGSTIYSDGRGEYTAGTQNVRSHIRFWAALWTNFFTQGGRHGTRSLNFDLRNPVPGGGGVPLGIANDRYAEFHAHWGVAHNRTELNLNNIPIGSTVQSDEADFGLYINGVIHNFSIGPVGKGTECQPGESIINGRGTTPLAIARPNARTWIVDAPPGSIGRLWDIHNTDLYAVDRGLYYFSIHMVFTTQPELAQCRLELGADSMFHGACVSEGDSLATIALRQPSGYDPLWRGTAKLSYRPSEEPLALDLRAGGTFRTATAWFDIPNAHLDGGDPVFIIDMAQESAPTPVDTAILRRALTYLPDATHWNPSDTRDSRTFDCPTQPAARTLFCALYDASVAVTGEYFHGRPGINAVRTAVGATAATSLRHPLIDYNNLPGMTVSQIQMVLEDAIRRIEGQPVAVAPN